MRCPRRMLTSCVTQSLAARRPDCAAEALGAAGWRRQHKQRDAAGAQHRQQRNPEALGGRRRRACPGCLALYTLPSQLDNL